MRKSKFEIEFAHLMPDVFEGVSSFSDLKAKIGKMSSHKHYPEFSGFLFEHVVAQYFYKFGEHHSVDVCDYRQTYAGSHGVDADYGIDGYGCNILGTQRLLCQVKYRSSPSDRIGAKKRNNKNELHTFINEIVRNLEIDENITILLCSTTNEYVKLSDRNTMEKIPFAQIIKNELKLRNANYAKMRIKAYDLHYWEIVFNNSRFWEFVRRQFAMA
jgi:hypothetical protein